MDLWTLKETFVDRFYEKLGTKVQPGWSIMDIGAGFGDFTIFAAQVEDTNVYAFEPFIQSFELLNQNVIHNNFNNIKSFQIAVWSEAGRLTLEPRAGDALQTRAGNLDLENATSVAQSVESISLEQALNLMQQKECDLLKLDCEGAEYPILMKAPENILKRVKRMVMEYHDFPGTVGHQALAAYLKSHGYKVTSKVNDVHDNIGYMYAELP